MKHVVYHLPSGEITKYARLNEENIELNQEPGESYSIITFPIADVSLMYMVDGEPAYRPVMTLTYSPLEFDVSEELVVTGIPAGSTVHYPGGSVTVDDGTIEWGSVVAGRFPFSIEKFPYLTERFNVEVTEA